MLDSCQNAQERWGGVHKLIDRWLEERQELVQAFGALRDAKPAFADKDTNGDFALSLSTTFRRGISKSVSNWSVRPRLSMTKRR